MTIKEFIEQEYDVRDRIAELKRDPIKDFINSDIFPCDFIEKDGNDMVKMIYYAGGQKDIAVLDLLSYRREELVKMGDKDLLEIFDTYTSNFKFDGDDLFNTVRISLLRDSLK